MAEHPYTTRLVAGRGPSGEYYYVVPGGYRAVVIHVTVAAWTSTGQVAFVWCAGQPIYYWPAPGANAVDSRAVHGVAYAGETVRVTISGTDCSFHVTGYLLRDDGSGPRVAQVADELSVESAHDMAAILAADHARLG